ncbi:unnamed protein product [Prunus armeniaca]|uniref:Uncharacterized protein n=1 Tax=Prunus armeniaca TaxID=36596 RepID=A0A6J5VXF1_PRUAR|nr:unnamed protein product [Prunus armeniaca]
MCGRERKRKNIGIVCWWRSGAGSGADEEWGGLWWQRTDIERHGKWRRTAPPSPTPPFSNANYLPSLSPPPN